MDSLLGTNIYNHVYEHPAIIIHETGFRVPMALVRILQASAALHSYFCLYLIPQYGLYSKSSVAYVAKTSPAGSEAGIKDRFICAAHRGLPRPSSFDQKLLAYILYIQNHLSRFFISVYHRTDFSHLNQTYYPPTYQTNLPGLLTHHPLHPSQTKFPFTQHIQPSIDVSLPS